MISKPLLTTGRNPTLIFPLTFTLLVLFLLYLILAECELEFRRKFIFINLQNGNEIYKMKLLTNIYIVGIVFALSHFGRVRTRIPKEICFH